ncbi:O-antigen ligase family protein [Salinivibrio sp. PR919]|uniref:O-antigen ligase family protein n=1 Tax=Salinivibrio sp. PR919 TaxID=1909491 RepID=UPI00130195DA|nr:O-antigen ligase family protein [Salinivibrio sp. PR919]
MKLWNIQSVADSKSFVTLMILCCLGYAVFKTSYRWIGDIFQSIVILGVLFSLYYDRGSKTKEPLFFLMLISAIVPVLSWINALFKYPDIVDSSPDFGAIVNFYFFLFITYWIKRDRLFINGFMIAFCFGVLLTLVSYSPNIINEFLLGMSGERIDFSYVNANHPAALLGASIIVAVSLFIRKSSNTPYFWRFAYVMLGCFILVALFALIFTQSRQSWLALIVSLGLMLWVGVYRKYTLNPWLILFIVAGLTILIAMLLAHIPIIHERLMTEKDVILAILSFDLDKIPFSSIGIRIHLWAESLKWIAENPLLGISQHGRALVISMSEGMPDDVVNNFTHLHNGYIDVLVNYGVVGLSVFIFSIWSLLRRGMDKTQKTQCACLSVGFIIFFLTINMFESFLTFKSGEFIFNSVAAMILSMIYNEREKGDA